MGLCLDSDDIPELGEYSVEVRRESFVIGGADSYNGRQRHAIDLYPNVASNQGRVEFLLEDIPKIEACLAAVKEHLGLK